MLTICSWLTIPSWRRRWQPTAISLLEKSHVQRSLAGHRPWDRKESVTTERPRTLFPASGLLSRSLVQKTSVRPGHPSSVPKWSWRFSAAELRQWGGRVQCTGQEGYKAAHLLPPENYPEILLGPVEVTHAIIKVTKCMACSLLPRHQIVRNKK